MTDKNAKLGAELDKAQSLATSQRDDISDLREEISKARGETGKLSRERNKLEQDLKDERARFANLQNELMETGRAIAEQETRWREELTAEKLRVQSLERSVADEERRFKKMEEECERLGLIAEERGKLKVMIEASVARERTLEGAKEKLEKRVHVAEARVNVLLEEQTRRERETAVHIEKEKEEMKEEIEALKATVKVLKEERTNVHHQLEREQTSLAVQAEKLNALERDLKQAAHTHTERQALLESTTYDLRESQCTVRDLQKDITALRTKLEKRDEQLESLRTSIDTHRAEIVEKDKHIVDLEFIIASTPSPTKKSRDEDLHLKLQKREKEILRIRELMISLLHDNEDLLAQSKENLVPEQQKKYNAMKNVLRAERERRKNVERELLRMQAKASLRGNEMAVTPGGSRSVSFFETPASGVRGLDTPISLNDTPGSLRGFEDTPLKGKGVFAE
jgi:chromosome segregation ATPase